MAEQSYNNSIDLSKVAECDKIPYMRYGSKNEYLIEDEDKAFDEGFTILVDANPGGHSGTIYAVRIN